MKNCLAALLVLAAIPLFGQQIFRKGDFFGLAAADGTALLEPVCDTIYRPVSNFPLFIFHANNQYHCLARIGGEQTKWTTFGSWDGIEAAYRDAFRQGMEVTVDGQAGCLFLHFETTGRVASRETLYAITRIDSTQVRYDAIEWNRFSATHGFATLMQDGKFGLFSDLSHLQEPMFDDRPQYCGENYFIVQRESLQGVLMLDSTKGFRTVVAPAYRGLEWMGGALFHTGEPGEELKVIHARTGAVFAIRDSRNKTVRNPDDGISGYDLYCNPDTYGSASCGQLDESSVLYISRHFSKLEDELPLHAGIRELYVYDLKGKKLLSFEDPEAVYDHPVSGWLSEARWANERHTKVVHTFYNLPTGDKLFSLKVAPQWRISIRTETQGEKRWNRIELVNHDHHSSKLGGVQRVQKGFYNPDTGKYRRFLRI